MRPGPAARASRSAGIHAVSPGRDAPGSSKPKRAVFVQFTAEPSGSPLSGLLIVRELRQRGWTVDAVFGRPGTCAALYEAEGCTVHHLPHGLWLSADRWYRQLRRWSAEWTAAHAVSRLIRDVRPDLVYVNNITGLAGALAARWRGVPCVWHLRELFQDVGGEVRDPPWGGRGVVRMALNRLASHIVAVSNAVRINVVGERSVPPVTVVPNAAFQTFFHENRPQEECRRVLGLPAAAPLIGVPGTLRPMKGHPFFLEAAARALRTHPDLHFAITGSGTPAYRAQLDALIAGTSLVGHVHFLGTVADMAAFYRACDVICVPSRSDPCPRAAIEPLAIGTPVIGTDVGGIAETIDHGSTGYLVPHGDPDTLAEHMVRLIDDPGLRAAMGTAARASAEDRYREEIYTHRILTVIDSVLARRTDVDA